MPFAGKAHIAYLPVGAWSACRRWRGWSMSTQAPADAGAPDLAGGDRDRGNAQAARRRRDDGSRAHLHVGARRDEAGLEHRHHKFTGMFKNNADEQARFITLVRSGAR